MADSQEERAHWRDILRAFDGYMQYHLAANHARRMAFLALPRAQREIYEVIGFRDKLEAVDEGIRQNSEFIDLMIQDPVFADMLAEDEPVHPGSRSGSLSGSHGHGHDHGDGAHGHEHDHGGRSHSHDAHSHGSHTSSPSPAPSDHHSHSHSHSHSSPSHANSHGGPRPNATKQKERDQQQDKVRSTLRSFVRDWSKEGKPERDACYAPLLDALERYFPDASTRASKKVLVPGCGLGRLAMEIAARGFWSQGNEFSTYMLIASHFALNQSTRADEHRIFPFLHSWSNHLTTGAHLLRSVTVPDVVPAEILKDVSPGAFSLVAGDFEEVYGPSQWRDEPPVEDEDQEEGSVNQKGRWSAVVTCFFIDTARNVLNYLRIIHGLLADDGVWINIGPLLWHFENAPASHKGELSLELSLDEVKELARKVGFDLVEEKMVNSTYTGTPDGMLQHVYNCSFWVARKVKPAPEMEAAGDDMADAE